MNHIRYSQAAPINDGEFKKLVDETKKRCHKENFMDYYIIYSFAYYCGFSLKKIYDLKLVDNRIDIDDDDLPENFEEGWLKFIPIKVGKRGMQHLIMRILGKPFSSLKIGFVLRKMNQGYSLAYIYKKLGYASTYSNSNLILTHVRNKLSPRKRLKVLKRDNFKCVYCGRGYPDVKLHVDHIIPLRRKGKNSMNNLQTLCQTCNIAKKDKDITKENK